MLNARQTFYSVSDKNANGEEAAEETVGCPDIGTEISST
jgi:hypothetical protein